jgi:hypothetical protein
MYGNEHWGHPVFGGHLLEGFACMHRALVHDQERRIGILVFLAPHGNFRKKCVSERVHEKIAVNVRLPPVINFNFLERVTK